MLIGAPELHHWHHDRDRDAGNYANISPLMDLLFGTYRCPDHEPEHVGISEPMPQGYFRQMLHPFLPARPQAREIGSATVANTSALRASPEPEFQPQTEPAPRVEG